MRWLYSLIWYLATPIIAIWLAQLAFRDPVWRHGWRERFGLLRAVSRGGIWVHAASMGEVQAALQLVQNLRMRYPERPLLLTAFTPSGRDHALRHLPEGVRCALLPFDFPGATRRFIDTVRPRLAIIVETELWPNLFAACERAGVPMLMVSARVTERGAKAYGRWRSLVARTLSIPQVITTQTDGDAQRIQALGADPTRVTVGGNIKFDFQLPAGIAERADALAEETGLGGRRVWIAASTHPGEEAEVLVAHRALLATDPDAVLVMAPRHPGRAEQAAQSIAEVGMRYVRRSEGQRCEPDTQVYLVDTLGELALFYGLVQLAFVGGTLVPVGGHNLLEPAAFDLPVLCGPHTRSVAGMFRLLENEDAIQCVSAGAELGAAVRALFADEQLRSRRGKAARRVLEQNRGAVERIMQLVSGILPE